jgi:putative MATE family efflux protein
MTSKPSPESATAGAPSVRDRVLGWLPAFLASFGLIDETRGRRALELAWPRSVSGIARYSFRTTDLIMVGWAVGTAGISALAFGFTVYILLKRFGIGFSAATLSLVSQRYGNDEHEEASFVLKQSLLLAAAFTVPITAVTYVTAAPVIDRLGATPEVVRLGTPYLQLMAIGFGFQFFNLVCSRAYAGIGDTRTPMYVRSAAAVGNIALNGVLIFGLGPFPALGVVGAGLGTILATASAAVAFAYLLAYREPDLTFRVPGRHWDTAVVRDIFRVASPAVGRKLLQTGARFPILVILATFGTGVVAAYEIGRRVLQLVRTPMWGLNFAASSLVGQSLGRDDAHDARAYTRDITVLSFAVLIPLFAVVAVFPAQFGRVFVDDQATIDLVVFFLQIYAVGSLGYTLDEALSGALTGAGDTRWPFYGTLVGLYLVLVPGAYLLGITFGLGLLGVGIALLAEFYVPAAVNYYRIRSDRWMAWSLSNG